jgi:ubiquinone/menaquinone biosynthesis C-methylase UbiE
MESATLAEVFDELADSYDHGHHEEIARALIAWADPGATARVADVACGAGAVALQVARGRPDTAPAVLAVDLSPGMVATGRERSVGLVPVGAIDWRVADAVPLPVPDHSLVAALSRRSGDGRLAARPASRGPCGLHPAAGHALSPIGTLRPPHLS